MTTNAELLNRCKRGDAAAWQMLIERYAALIHSVPVRYGFTQPEVEDIGQEVFAALAHGLHQIEDPDRLPAWLLTTARRYSWRALQKRKIEQPALADDLTANEMLSTGVTLAQPVPTMSELLDGWQRQELIHTALARLGERCRSLLSLIFLDQREPSYDEISARMNMPRGSIGPTRIRCLQQMRVILAELGETGVA
jgi:RNA polymerase sigma factor (sigma-70 family)